MFSTQSIDTSLGAPCRALDCIPGQDAWIVGTCALPHHDESTRVNTLQIIEYDPDLNELHCRTTMMMEDNIEPIRCLATIPNSHMTNSNTSNDDGDVVQVAVATEQGSSILLYELPASSSSADATNRHRNQPVAKIVAKLTPDGGFGASILKLCVSKPGTAAAQDANQLLLLALDNSSHLSVWDLHTSQEIKSVDLLDLGACSVQWDPHSANGTTMVAVGLQKTLHLLDWRVDTAIPTGVCAKLHCRSIVHDFDYNPNKPHTIAVASQDGHARIWDLRHHQRPVLTVAGGHSHWMSTISYNPFHDQLVLTTGTEGRANIWRLGSVSSAPLLQSRNRRVASHTKTMSYTNNNSANTIPSEPIYAAQWAASDAWMYATVSWDGTMALHHVPSKEKYKILL